MSKLFLQTTCGALAVGLLGALFSWDWFVPGAIIGAIAALLSFGIQDPDDTIFGILKRESDTNIFRAFLEDLFNRIPEFGNEVAAAGLLIDGTDIVGPEDSALISKNATMFVPMDMVMCSDAAMTRLNRLRQDNNEWKKFVLSHICDVHLPLKELNQAKSVTSLSGRVIMLDKLRDARIQMLPYDGCNGTLYKIGALLVPGKYVKEQSDME